ncbi:unnamed protein product [Closterium sp. NIES-53]
MTLVELDFFPSSADPSLFVRCGSTPFFVLVYVDDLVFTTPDRRALAFVKEELQRRHTCTDLGELQRYLGVQITRDRAARTITLTQSHMVEQIITRFCFPLSKQHCNAVGAEGAARGRLRAARNLAGRKVPRAGDRARQTPPAVDAYTELTFDDKEAQEHEEEEYWQKVGSLQFAATTTRPDIAFACSKLGSGLMVWSDQHWREVNRCLAYLADTRETSLEFSGRAESLKLVGYVDAYNVVDKQNWTSTGGYVLVFGGAAISWLSQCIKCATLSSTKSEYVAATEAGKEGCSLRFLLAEFQLLDAGTPTVLRVDNKSAITIAEGLGLQDNLKHKVKRRNSR